MKVTFRIIAIATVVVGLGFGAAFGAGIAYGRGDPKTVAGGLTSQQLASMLGVTGAQAALSAGAAATPATGGAGAARAGAATGALSAVGATGRITAVQGQTITIETRQGSEKINLSSSTTITKLISGGTTDLTEGTSIVVAGTRKDDGSYDATSISQVPTELQAVLGISGAQTGR